MRVFVAIIAATISFACTAFAQTDSTSIPASTPSVHQQQEVLKIDWPGEYNWKVGTNQENAKMHLVEVIPGTETVENWSIIGSLLAIKGMTNMPMDVVLKGAEEQKQKTDSLGVLTVLERNDTAATPYVLFKVESPTLHGTPGRPESDMFFVMQGKTALFNAIVGVHEAKLSDDFVSKWKSVFRSSRLTFE